MISPTPTHRPLQGAHARLIVVAIVTLTLLVGCTKAPDSGPISAAEARLIRSLCLNVTLPPSPGNRVADDANAAKLGRALFFDKRLSANGQVACSTCHDPAKYFTDGRATAKGIADTPRGAPSIVGSQWLPFVFWDGRKDSLWSQALGPIEADVEHGFSRVAVARHLATHHRAAYEALFEPLPTASDFADFTRFPRQARPVDDESRHAHNVEWNKMSTADQATVNTIFANFGKVLEAYERKLLPRKAPFDRFACDLQSGAAATGHKSLSDTAVAGLRAFVGGAGCVNCHNGPLLTDKGFHNLGLPKKPGQSGVDVGRTMGAGRVKIDPFRCGTAFSDSQDCEELKFLNPRFEDFVGAFKTPSLRNVAQTAPYMHAGHLKTLKDVVKHYKELPGKAEIGHRDLVLKQVDADVDTDALVAFLQTLTGPPPEEQWRKP